MSACRSVLGFVSTLCVVASALLLTSAPAALASEGCENEARRVEQASTFLPDCRAYELLTVPGGPPINYSGYNDGLPPITSTIETGNELEAPFSFPGPQPFAAFASDGNAALYDSYEPNALQDGTYTNLLQRGSSGWFWENIEPTQSKHQGLCDVTGYVAFSQNLEQIAISDGESEALSIGGEQQPLEYCGHDEPRLVPGEPEESANLFLRDSATHSFQLVNVTPPGTTSHQPFLEAISADGSHVVFNSSALLTPDAPLPPTMNQGCPQGGEEWNEFGDLYVWTAGAVHLLTILPAGAPVLGTLAGAHPDYCGSSPIQTAGFTNAVSADGERALFYHGGRFEVVSTVSGGTRPLPKSQYIGGGLYLRLHPSAEQSVLLHGGATGQGTLTEGSNQVTSLTTTTGEFAVGQAIAGPGIPAATTITAVAPGALTLSATASASGTLVSLEAASECTEPQNACTVQVDASQGGSGSGGGTFQWANAEATKIFFTGEEKLTSNSTARAGKPDLYEYDVDKPQGQRLTDVTLSASEPADVLGVAGASEDGSYLYFVTQANLTGEQQNSHGDTALGRAEGTGRLIGPSHGEGTLTAGSNKVTNVTAVAGAFFIGQEIEGQGIPSGAITVTTITACAPSCSAPTELTLSRNAIQNGTYTLTGAGPAEVTGLNATTGVFHAGMAIGGSGVRPDTLITAVGAGTLTLSRGVTEGGTATLSATAANLYVRHGALITFITSLNAETDRCDWTARCLTSRVSQNGAFIGFDSFDSLTGYDNRPLRSEACFALTRLPGQACPETFRYAATSSGNPGELTCASCNPTGAPPVSEFAWSVIGTPGQVGIEKVGLTLQMSHNVSNSGQVFFETTEKLVRADENESFDVYEYEGGEGPSAQLHLISPGKSEREEPSYFFDATPDGSNLFFITDQALVRSDTRSDYALYDARVNGGFLSQDEAVQSPPCGALEACRAPLSEPPAEFSAGSAAFAGAGNLVSSPPPPPVKKLACKKGFHKMKIHGKAVCKKVSKHHKRKSKKAKKATRATGDRRSR